MRPRDALPVGSCEEPAHQMIAVEVEGIAMTGRRD
jgi:hypothetical protein